MSTHGYMGFRAERGLELKGMYEGISRHIRFRVWGTGFQYLPTSDLGNSRYRFLGHHMAIIHLDFSGAADVRA